MTAREGRGGLLTLQQRQIRHERHVLVHNCTLSVVDRTLQGLVQGQGVVVMCEPRPRTCSTGNVSSVVASAIRVGESVRELGLECGQRLKSIIGYSSSAGLVQQYHI